MTNAILANKHSHSTAYLKSTKIQGDSLFILSSFLKKIFTKTEEKIHMNSLKLPLE